MATTWDAIRLRYCGSTTARGRIEQITPTICSDKPFKRSPQRSKLLRDWADGTNSIQFRAFEWLRTGPAQEPETLSDPKLTVEQATLTIAYPVMPSLYGTDDLDSMETLIRTDARLVRDVLLSPGNLVAQCHAVLPVIQQPERNERVWFQDIVCELIYYESQTLT